MRVRIAAVQPALVVGDVEGNLRRVEDLIRDAARTHRPDLIVVPEGFSSPNVYHPVMRTVPRPIDGAPFSLLRELSRELGCIVAGGALSMRGDDVFGTYMALEPDGRAHFHDKDIPSGTEYYFNRGGDDDGVTSFASWNNARIGLASGLEWGRTGTARRLRAAEVDLVVGGQCWPWTATNWRGPIGRWSQREFERSIGLCAEIPATMARSVGAPTVMASHVGPVSMHTPYAPGITWESTMVGETRICSADGSTLASLSLEDGEGHVGAVVEIGHRDPVEPLPDDYWTFPMAPVMTAAFYGLNAVGLASYLGRKARRGYPWQQLPGADLADELPPLARGRRRAPVADDIPVVVSARADTAEDVVSLTLRSADGRPLPTWTAGAHIDVRIDENTVRQYSLCGSPASDEYSIGVLRERDGRGGSERLCAVRKGTELTIRGPRNHFAFRPRSGPDLFVAGGIGITPILSMVRQAAADGRDWHLIYTARSAGRHALREQIAELDQSRVELRQDDVDGLLDVPGLVSELRSGTQIYACGPTGLLAALEAACADAGIDLFVERFSSAVREGVDVAFDLVAAASGVTVRVEAHISAMEALRNAGVSVDASCESGVCGSCQVAVLAGIPDQRDAITTRRGCENDNVMMLCVSRSTTESITVDL